MTAFSWATDPDVATSEQTALRELVTLTRPNGEMPFFSRGLAIGTAYDENTRKAVAVALAFDASGQYSQVSDSADIEVDFPYLPGLLAFRVGPAICKLLDQQEEDYDFLLFDGQGIAHPRGIGLASHIGVLYDKMSVGVTRNRLYGEVLEPPASAGAASPIYRPKDRSIVGHSLVPSDDCPPIYVSPGNRLNPKEALDIVRGITRPPSCFPKCLGRAHAMANSARRQLLKKDTANYKIGKHDE